MSLKSKERERASYVYDMVREYRIKNKNNLSDAEDKFKSYAKNVLSYIQLNGLIAAFAFVEVKKGKGSESANIDARAYEALYNITAGWLKKEGYYNSDANKDGEKSKNLSGYFSECETGEYRAVQQEVLKVFNWIRRYAECGEL